MKQKNDKPIYKKWWFWALVVLVVIIMGNKDYNTTSPTPSNDEAATVEESAIESTTSDEDKELTIVEQITAITEETASGIEDLKVYQGAPDTSLIKISYTSKNPSWSETDFISNSFTDYIDICSQVYKLEGIKKVELFIFVEMIDAKGNVDNQKGFAVCMPKENFDTYTWENLKFTKGIYSTVINDCELWDVHAGIEKNVNYDDVMYE